MIGNAGTGGEVHILRRAMIEATRQKDIETSLCPLPFLPCGYLVRNSLSHYLFQELRP